MDEIGVQFHPHTPVRCLPRLGFTLCGIGLSSSKSLYMRFSRRAFGTEGFHRLIDSSLCLRIAVLDFRVD